MLISFCDNINDALTRCPELVAAACLPAEISLALADFERVLVNRFLNAAPPAKTERPGVPRRH